jgi:hypothetical protein
MPRRALVSPEGDPHAAMPSDSRVMTSAASDEVRPLGDDPQVAFG